MPRQRMQPGEHGKVTQWSNGGRYFASTYVRDTDGRRRRVERSSDKSVEDARRLLQRHLQQRRAPLDSGQIVTGRTALAELFELWIEAKAAEDGISHQSVDQYRQVWRVHGAEQLGALRITELSTSRASRYLLQMGAVTQAKRLRMILSGMFALAVRYDVIPVNPIRETKTTRTTRKPVRAATPAEFNRIRAAVTAYANRKRSGPRRGAHRLLPAFIECLAATGVRPNEVLGILWPDVDLLGDPPTVTVTGTMIDHGKVAGKPLHRQEHRKHGAPAHTVVLPRFGVEALTALVAETGGIEGPVFANRDGGWMSLANMRRALRAALPADLAWVTPHSFRRTVATVVRDAHGPAAAQQQLSHTKLATTEAHYLQRHTRGPDVRAALDEYAGQQSGD
ncbi:tyrosine-type recombinase/integrase [Mycolicibacterium wolinskyi]|uniref:Integrase n=1 Tax=Mycolicibacterium wolinskyi TaxID=59750 RepID=A0A1X2FAA8_9MYCO|nr:MULTISPECIES: tyrosine-type recombinase/integrase [Mycolicibacterium]MCV7285359.1 tyrosine-type recombinase/integrase [Mycolicibacterium wolinskyi]MCV7295138.1 tyrosine-type recombinase/integrase [Mycolicibacterium goodii]ORX15334.1 integrase [Mycolicibacterium wolinskyi]